MAAGSSSIGFISEDNEMTSPDSDSDELDREFTCDSTNSLKLKLVRQTTDIYDDAVSFSPFMTHQLYGSNEEIFGYRGLEIMLYYTACSLKPYIGIDFAEQLIDDEKPVEEPTQKIKNLLPKEFFIDLVAFAKSLDTEHNFKPYGRYLDTKILKDDRVFVCYTCPASEPGFKDFHYRLQVFLLWFVDAASFIDVQDDKWRFFLLYETYFDEEGRECNAIVGYMTVYEFFAYPSLKRPRISQVLVLPPFQRIGLCSWAIQQVYNYYKAQDNIRDITVEDPSAAFQRVRDVVDCRNCCQAPQYKIDIDIQTISKELLLYAKEALLLNPIQARRVYEILRLRSIRVDDEVKFNKYKEDVINRLRQPFMKEAYNYEKRCRLMKRNPPQSLSMSSVLNKKQVEVKFDRLFAAYQLVVDRLNNMEGIEERYIDDDNKPVDNMETSLAYNLTKSELELNNTASCSTSGATATNDELITEDKTTEEMNMSISSQPLISPKEVIQTESTPVSSPDPSSELKSDKTTNNYSGQTNGDKTEEIINSMSNDIC